MSDDFRTPGGAFDVMAFVEYLRTNQSVLDVSAVPTGERNDGPPEFHVDCHRDEAREVLGDAALSLPDGASLSGRRFHDDPHGVVFTVFDRKA